MSEKIPVTVITGFLGSGKTTLVRHLLGHAQGKRIALIINEFGDIGVDKEVLAGCGDETCREEDMIELANGCICCTVADDFIPTMKTLLERDERPDHIVIETSGLALPQPLIRAFNWPEIKTEVTIDGVVTVVDAAALAEGRFASDEEAVDAQRKADSMLDHETPLGELFKDQLVSADLIIVNKAQLVSDADLAAVDEVIQREARPGTATLRGSPDGLAPEILLGLASATENHMTGRESHHDLEGEEHDHDDFTSFVVALPPVASLDDLRARIGKTLALPGVLRVKGRVAVEGKPAPAVIQAVGPRIESYFAPGTEATGLVVIGLRDIDRDAITKILRG